MVSDGTWRGNPSSFSYQWLRCDPKACYLIAGEATPSYIVRDADRGYTIQVWFTAANAWGVTTASARTGFTKSTQVTYIISWAFGGFLDESPSPPREVAREKGRAPAAAPGALPGQAGHRLGVSEVPWVCGPPGIIGSSPLVLPMHSANGVGPWCKVRSL